MYGRTDASLIRAAAFLGALWPLIVGAVALPSPEALRTTMPMPAAVVRVVEPHLSEPQRRTVVAYRGWPAEAVLDDCSATTGARGRGRRVPRARRLRVAHSGRTLRPLPRLVGV